MADTLAPLIAAVFIARGSIAVADGSSGRRQNCGVVYNEMDWLTVTFFLKGRGKE